ncbi:hypothetical protein LA080_005339 [Diaporthe eres]|nr:hypothetical protein LA080_005339 [Diaporthe eres]
MSSQGLPSSSTHEEGRKFTCFLRLPVELQLLVWEHAFQSNRADIVLFGGDGNVILATPSMMAMSLVLGNELPNIMVPALAFVSHVIGDLSLGTVEPVSAALARLRAVDPVWNEIFRPGANTLPRPGLPRNIYFLLVHVPSTRLADRRPRLDCLHFEHLSFFPPSATAAAPMTRSFDIRGGFQGLENYVSMRRIQDFWDNVQNAPGLPVRTDSFRTTLNQVALYSH